MGKKAKKKLNNPQREKNNEATLVKSAKIVPIEIVEEVVSMVKERKKCIHFEKGVNLVQLATKDWSAGDVVCEDCKESAGDRRGGRGKSKGGKKKGHGGESYTDGKAIWVCLQCGHRACGGVGLPTTPQSHAVRHARQSRHPMTVHCENPHLRWCFQCSTLIPVAKYEEKEEGKDVMLDAVKIIQNQLSVEVSKDVESSSIRSACVKTGLGENSATSDNEYYVVRGLSNLGNTCFFNSIMQNLLSMDKLRAYFCSMDDLFGPLTISLKKLFAETSLDTGKKGALNPKSFFGCVCAKAPQFKGYQQQDSHELLRCLLDGLSMEELSVRKQIKLNHESDVRPKPNPTFVDLAFGGQVSSTVCCLECGHASTVCEPFLDLSLPVPTRKPPKKTQHVSPARRAKVPIPPRRAAKIHIKPKKYASGDPNIIGVESNCESSMGASSVVEDTASSSRSDGFDQPAPDHVSQSHCSFPSGDVANICSGDSAAVDLINSTTAPDSDTSVLQQDQKEDDMSWLDFLESDIVTGEQNIQIEEFDAFGDVNSSNIDGTMHDTSDVNLAASDTSNERTPEPSGNTATVDDEVPLLVQDCQVILLPYTEEHTPDLELMEGQSSSAFTGQEEDASDFSGFGGLFDEPEPVIGPSPKPDGERNMKDSGTTNSFASESDPDEVDDKSPVSIETCLAYFIKPELLTKEQGWYCEKCSKVLQHQKGRSQYSLVNSNLHNGSNDIDAGKHVAKIKSEKCLPFLKQEGVQSNGETFGNGVTNMLLQNGAADDKKETRHIQDPVDSSYANEVSSIKDLTNMLLSPVSFSNDSNCNTELSLASTSAEYPNLKSGDISHDKHDDNEDIESSPAMLTRDATKRLLIEKAPPILTIHLKRFSQDLRGRLSKLNGHVAFGETIDLRPYINPRCVDGDAYVYRLAGIVVHTGTMRGGHYEAYIRGKRNTWYHTSDSYVREATLEEVLRSEAYILFYIKIE